MKEMASTVFRNPEAVPSSEAAHAALLFAHIAWNQRADVGKRRPDFRPMLKEFEASRPSLWDELISRDADALIGRLAAYRDAHHPHDFRYLVVCGISEGKVHAEWCEPEQIPLLDRTKEKPRERRRRVRGLPG
jgi:hypothetical protein